MNCPGGVGYKGYLLVCSNVLPFLSSDLVRVTEIVPSASIHGGGNSATNPVFRDQVNFSIGRQITEGSITTEIFGGSGNYATAWQSMLDRAIGANASDISAVCTGFDSSCYLIYAPGGGSEYVLPSSSAAQAKALIASMELRGNNGGNVQSTFRIISAGADYNNSSTNAPSAASLAFETAGSSDDSNPIPYYQSNFTVTGSGETSLVDRITDWSISVNNNANPIYTFNGENFPQDILLGQRVVTGSFSYYSADGTFVENLTHGASITITFGSVTLTLPFIAFGRAPLNNGGPNAPVTRTVEFTGFAKSSSEPSIYQS